MLNLISVCLGYCKSLGSITGSWRIIWWLLSLLGNVWYLWEAILGVVWGSQHHFVVMLEWNQPMGVCRNMGSWHMRHNWMSYVALVHQSLILQFFLMQFLVTTD